MSDRVPLRPVMIEVSCKVPASFRVQQVRGMFDLQAGDGESFGASVQVPAGGDWRIGAIVGPSGSGKSTVAKAAFGEALYGPGVGWPEKGAVVDGFAEAHSIKVITAMLTAVGFSSPPAWLRPYGVLSNGEKFRCDLARALLGGRGGVASVYGGDVVAFDEFTSLVDRRVAQVGSMAVAKAVRSGRCDGERSKEQEGRSKKAPRPSRRFVAVTCHYDVLPWLQPDWVLDMASGKLARGALCRRICGGTRPDVRITLRRCGREAWGTFARHHYLTGKLPPLRDAFVATWEGHGGGEPVAFCAVSQVLGYAGYERIARLVVLPDYQGIGIGTRVLDAVAEITAAKPGVRRVGLVTSHPGMIAACTRGGAASRWKCVKWLPTGSAPDVGSQAGTRRSTGRAVVGFEFVK